MVIDFLASFNFFGEIRRLNLLRRASTAQFLWSLGGDDYVVNIDSYEGHICKDF